MSTLYEYSQFLLPILYDIVAIYFIYLYAVITQYIIIVTLSKTLSARSIKNKKRFYSTFIYCFYDSLPFFMQIQFLTYIIFLLPEELLLTFLKAGLLAIKHLSFGLYEVFIPHYRRIISLIMAMVCLFCLNTLFIYF